MSSNSEADQVLTAFAGHLASAGAPEGWTLVRSITGNADRAFEAKSAIGTVAFRAHLSQSENGFWGLTPDHATEMLRHGREHLVLLRSGSTGYFVSNVALQRLMSHFSVNKKTGAIKINEGVIRAQPRFRDIDELWDMLKARSIPPAP